MRLQKPWMVETQAWSRSRARSARSASRRRARMRSTQLAGRPLGERDGEDAVRRHAALQHGAAEALHEHARLARAGAGVDEDRAGRADRPLLVGVQLHAVGSTSALIAAPGRRPPTGRRRGRSRRAGRGGRRRGGCARRAARRWPGRRRSRPRSRGAAGRRWRRGPAGGASSCAPSSSPRVMPPRAERPEQAADGLEPEQLAQRQQVERDLQPAVLEDAHGRVGRHAGLVVVDQPARRHPGIGVDAVDLADDREVAEPQAVLEPRRRAGPAERDLEAAGDQRRRAARRRGARTRRGRGSGAAPAAGRAGRSRRARVGAHGVAHEVRPRRPAARSASAGSRRCLLNVAGTWR